ncbi:MAG: glycine--tRNA ligase [Solitalea-like symbiont of Acarus siro]
MKEDKNLKQITSYCKEYGFIFRGSEIYDGISAIYDYGWLGVELKNNLKEYWWKSLVRMHNNIVGIDSAILMNPNVWKASGHIDNFHDPLIDNKDSKKRYRADQLIEDKILFYLKNGQDDKADSLQEKLDSAIENSDLSALGDIINNENIVCEVSKTCSWTEVKQFNLMFSTKLGATDDNTEIYLRPETAQGIFTNFLNIQKTSRQKPPFGIAQIGKAFRNEIVTRGFIIRMREFEQMEMQFFIPPNESNTWFEVWKEKRYSWISKIINNTDKLRFHKHTKLAHYASNAEDIEYQFDFGFKEIEGIHARGSFDLTMHEEHSGKKIKYFDPKTNTSYTPEVIETSIGLDRLFFLTIYDSLTDEIYNNDQTRTLLKIHPSIAPIKAAVFPLTKKPELIEKAQWLVDAMRIDLNILYDEKDSIGKRYRRQDAIGTPYCITIDFDSLETNNVTIRDRDTMEQTSINIDQVANFITDKVSIKHLLS